MRIHTNYIQIILGGTVFFVLLTSLGIASPLNKNEILSILIKSSKANKSRGVSEGKNRVAKKHVIYQKKKHVDTIVSSSMPKMKNSPYSEEIPQPIQKVSHKSLEMGKLPDIKPQYIFKTEERVVIIEKPAINEKPTTRKKQFYVKKANIKKEVRPFDSNKYLNVLF